MARALSDDLRVRVLKASMDGLSARGAAARFGVGISTAIRWIAQARQGERTARPQGRRRGSSLDAHEAFIVGLIEERRDITLNEMAGGLLPVSWTPNKVFNGTGKLECNDGGPAASSSLRL